MSLAQADEAIVCRILGGNNKATALRLAQVYFEKYDKKLVDDLSKELGGNFRRAAVMWVKSQDPTRGDDEAPEEEVADDDADGVAASAADLAAAAAAAIAAPVVVQEESKEVPPPELPTGDDDDDDDDDDDAELDEARAAKLAARRERAAARKAARDAHKAALLAEKQRKKQQEQEIRQRQKAVQQLVKVRTNNAKARLATVLGAKFPATGAIVGVFDAESYLRVNGASGNAWNHFLTQGFNEGCLLTVKTPIGLFAGIFDDEVYLNQHGIQPVNPDEAPYHPQQQAFADLQTKGPATPIPLKPAVAVTLYGRFVANLYYLANPDAVAYAHKPRPGAFDGAGYLKIHRDIGRVDPFDHLIRHGLKEKRDIVVNGRRGQLDRRWFKRHNDCNKVKKHLKKKPNARMKVKGRRMDGWQHYVAYGHNEGRRVRVVDGVGIFEGVFDGAAYASHYPDVQGDAWAHYRDYGHAQGRVFPLAQAITLTLFMDQFEELTVEPRIDDSMLAPQEVVSSDEEDDGDDSDDSDDDD
jgi:hypothetical protein